MHGGDVELCGDGSGEIFGGVMMSVKLIPAYNFQKEVCELFLNIRIC